MPSERRAVQVPRARRFRRGKRDVTGDHGVVRGAVPLGEDDVDGRTEQVGAVAAEEALRGGVDVDDRTVGVDRDEWAGERLEQGVGEQPPDHLPVVGAGGAHPRSETRCGHGRPSPGRLHPAPCTRRCRLRAHGDAAPCTRRCRGVPRVERCETHPLPRTSRTGTFAGEVGDADARRNDCVPAPEVLAAA